MKLANPITFPGITHRLNKRTGRFVSPDTIDVTINEIRVTLTVDVACGPGGYWHAGFDARGGPERGTCFVASSPASKQCKPHVTRCAAIVAAAKAMRVQLLACRGGARRSLMINRSERQALLAEAVFAVDEFIHEPRCRVCGCATNDCQFCIDRTGDACSWAEPDLCTACVGLEPAAKPSRRQSKARAAR